MIDRQAGQRFVERLDRIVGNGLREQAQIDVDPPVRPTFDCIAGAGMVNQDAPHRFGRRPEVIAFRGERSVRVQFQKRLMDERRRVERMAV